MNEFLQFLTEPLALRSLWACAVIGFSNGFVSATVLLRRSSLQIGTLSCALLPGIALAILLFGQKVRTWCISLIAWADSACPLTPP